MFIRTANDQEIVRAYGGYRAFVTREVTLRWRGFTPNWEKKGRAFVRAYVNRSNWVADCPYCPGSLVVQPGEPYYCPDCLMQKNGGFALHVSFPRARKTIERILTYRADPLTRNWLLGETVDDLKRENIEHGEPIDGPLPYGFRPVPLRIVPKAPTAPRRRKA